MTAPERPTGTWLLLLILAGCRSAERRREEQVAWDIQHGRYAEALEAARRLAADDPRDGGLQAMARDAELAYVLDLGRDEVFAGNLERALALFERAQALDPANALVASWIGKTRRQLATHWLDVAAGHTGPEGLEECAEAYEKALQYEPENLDARRGLAHVLLLRNYRAGLSKTYFEDGLASFRELLLQQARRGFQVSRHYRENEPAAKRAEQVEGMLADERLAQARELEAAGRYFAARNEYRLVLVADPDHPEGRAGLDRMDREARATRTLAEAEMELRRGELEEAAEALEQAAVLTEVQEDGLALLKNDIQERRHERLYEDARNLVSDYRYVEAVAAYEELLSLVPDYKDAALRKQTLEEFIRLADELYGKALEAKDDKLAEQYLRAIPVVWPEYKDVAERLAEIEARRAARRQGAKAGADGGAEPEDGG
jgi:tetratricopeptide (TPR) repeat protein